MAAWRDNVVAGWWYTVMVGEGRPSTSIRRAAVEGVDGGPSPAMTGGPEAMT